MKITFLGAGSSVFVKNVLGDCMLSDTMHDATYSLYDIDEERLKDSYDMLVAVNNTCNQGRAKFECYIGVENLGAALKDADFVVNAIQVGGYEPCTVTDFEIPKKIWPSSDHCRYIRRWRNFPCAADNSCYDHVC